MLTRRHLLATGLATFGLAAGGVRAQDELALSQVLAPELQPRFVPIQPGIPAGQIHVDPNRFALYWTQGDGTALRYAVGIGRPGLYEPGVYTIGARKEWPSWKPTPDMVEREPELYGPYAEEGMPGGPDNPLGARALYLFEPGRGDTFMRIHGTNAPRTIQAAVSNGCTRLINADIIDLYARVPVGTMVVLYPRSSLFTAGA
ncbi:L,D-transpeptidase [Rubellimicrobium aerolatum]|uniref:L,D-transpeptidase n=1 Tax=Rubellimicrobium aerolatum TaxID=490979 RepID=A0ABW0SFV7_9RHOB|nr:L,D-transpeptidase [Rubellimicrobium aerolatum]MBP1807269.1 lipoprotein-anchoring transpeptidase ErfK/SrfK [Rubellimicrobium aerolatum]